MGIVFQNYALYLHMIVVQNIGFLLCVCGETTVMIDRKVCASVGLVKIGELLDWRFVQLLGGQ